MNSRGTTTVQGSQQCIQRCQELPINLCIIFGQYILFDQAELYGLFVLFQICSDHHLNLIYIYYCCFWLFELCYVIMSIICVHCIYMCLHIIVHVYLYNYDKMFIDKLQIVLKSLLTCKIHKSALEYSIIRRYTNVVYYYIIIIQTCLLVVVEPGLVLKSPFFMRSSASQPAARIAGLPPKNYKYGPHCRGREVSTQFAPLFARPM